MEADKLIGVMCMVLQLDRRKIDEANNYLFWDDKMFRNIPMMHALGLVFRFMSNHPKPQTSHELESKWRKLWDVKVQLRATMFIIALYVAIKQIEVFKGDPHPRDVCKALLVFNVKVSVQKVNTMEMDFLQKLEWRTHFNSRPRPLSMEAGLSNKVMCEYDLILAHLSNIAKLRGGFNWPALYAMSRQLQ